jgi:hypothetical protein
LNSGEWESEYDDELVEPLMKHEKKSENLEKSELELRSCAWFQ